MCIRDSSKTVNNYKDIKSRPSLIVELIRELSDIDLTIDETYDFAKDDLRPYDINEKIKHNEIIKYKEIINEYGQYSGICEKAFNIIDNNKIGSKRKILMSISLLYKKYKGELLSNNGKETNQNDIEIIREKSDKMIDIIKNELEDRIEKDGSNDFYSEEKEIGLYIIICYAFVECKILEKPGV